MHSYLPATENALVEIHPLEHLFCKICVICFCIGLILLVCIDWFIHYGFLEPTLTRYIRGFLFCIFLPCLLNPDIWAKDRRFPLSLPFIALGVLITVYAVYKKDIGSELYYIIKILFWIVGTFFVYRMLLFKILTKKLLMLTINIITLIYSCMVPFSMLNSSFQFSQNISIYVLLWCFPLLLIQDKSLLRTILIISACFAILLSFKRGALLALIISNLAYLFCWLLLHRSLKAGFKVCFILISLALIVIFSFYTVSKIRPDFFASRVADLDNTQEIGSGRATFQIVALNHYKKAFNTEPLHFFMGFGSRSTQKVICDYYRLPYQEGAYAHSDLLQLLHDYGLIGLFVLLLFHISIIRLIMKAYKIKHPYFPPLVMVYTILFLMNIYSGLFFFPNAIYFGMFFSVISTIPPILPSSPATPEIVPKPITMETV